MSNVKGGVSRVLAPFPGTLWTVKKVYWSILDLTGSGQHPVRRNGNGSDPGLTVPDELDRDPEVYRDHAIVRVQDHCHYQYATQCDECDVKAICDGFHGDYASLFTSDEARPIRTGKKVTDPTYYIRHQVKIYEPEEGSRPFRHREPLAGNGAPRPTAA